MKLDLMNYIQESLPSLAFARGGGRQDIRKKTTMERRLDGWLF